MADSDGDYDMDLSDDGQQDDARSSRRGGKRPGDASSNKPKEVRARWEAGAQKNWNLHEGDDGTLEGILGGIEEASKRQRLIKDTTPLQRGIIRHTLLVLDLSAAMLEKDLRPTRFLLTLTYTMAFVREYFDQNPISQLGILGMRDGLATRISEMSGNPNDHLTALKALRQTEPQGSASIQNALDMCRAALWHTPSHGTREVVMVLGALSSSDPGDIHKTIAACVRDKLRITIIGLAAQLHICDEICKRTNGGDTSAYNVALDEVHYRELLLSITTPPVMRNDVSATASALLLMGFPSRSVEATPTLCACHGNLTQTGYRCSRCSAKVCSLPATCPSCDLTLILSTHLARSYRHLFPLLNWTEVSWSQARQANISQCFGCMAPFPAVPDKGKEGKRAKGASESSRYKCPACGSMFCIDCDVFCHEVVHNCPGCQSKGENDLIQDGNGNGEGNGQNGDTATNGMVMN